MMVRWSGRYSDAAIMRRESRRKRTESVGVSFVSKLRRDLEWCGVVRLPWRELSGVLLKINFSVPVNMYNEKVTSYW